VSGRYEEKSPTHLGRIETNNSMLLMCKVVRHHTADMRAQRMANARDIFYPTAYKR
jgi:hypothetical protein